MEIQTLIEKIKSTNNGYLFAPTGNDTKTAKANPDKFLVIATGNTDFPIKIYVK